MKISGVTNINKQPESAGCKGFYPTQFYFRINLFIKCMEMLARKRVSNSCIRQVLYHSVGLLYYPFLVGYTRMPPGTSVEIYHRVIGNS